MRQIPAVKTAIVGCGAISDIFFKNFTERFEILNLVSCCSRGRASAEKKANQYGIQASTLEEILADPEIELIVNLTPPGEHYETIKRAFEAGKHVWTEKTITTDFELTKELVSLAQEKNLLFGSEPDHFLGSAWQCAREYLDGGIIGDVTSAVVSVSQNYGVTADRIRFATEPGGGPGCGRWPMPSPLAQLAFHITPVHHPRHHLTQSPGGYRSASSRASFRGSGCKSLDRCFLRSQRSTFPDVATLHVEKSGSALRIRFSSPCRKPRS